MRSDNAFASPIVDPPPIATVQSADKALARAAAASTVATGTCMTAWVRSEEHTSELQSLMRISYAVFCLKKKKKNIKRDNNRHRELARKNKRHKHHTQQKQV